MESAMYSTSEYGGGGATHDFFAFENFRSEVYLMAVDAYSTLIPAMPVTRVQYHESKVENRKEDWGEERTRRKEK